MKVDALLARKGNTVVTLAPDRTVRDAVRVLTAHRIGALVVSSDGVGVEGIVSERDVVAQLDATGPAVLDAPVSAVMVTEVQTCAPDDHVASLMSVMTNRRIRHLPVVVGGKLAGMISIGDVVKARVDELEEDRERLHEYIGAR
jgi:CBS domain-containing protein